MIQRSQHLGFALKAGKPLGIVREGFWENFDRYIAPEFCVVRLVDFSHAARTNRASDFIRTEFCACGDCHSLLPYGNLLLQLFKPIQHYVDLHRCRLPLLGSLEHEKALAVWRDIITGSDTTRQV